MNHLDHWEKRLKPYFGRRMRFIGEIPLSFNDVEEMADGVKALIERHGIKRATDALERLYPLTLITLMSAFSAYNTEQNFWQAFADRLHVEKQYLYNYKWTKLYVALARKRGLKVFDFADDPTPYVTSIRFQGGIPAYSLPDYFEKMVLPAVQRENLRNIAPREALKYLLTHTYFVDSPVFDFLENSGEMGVTFFAESCRLARHALETRGEVLSADEVDLPAYVVEAFERWWEHREDARQHWRKPYLQAAPYSEDTAFNLILPQQEIALELAATRLFWRIADAEHNRSQERPCKVSRGLHGAITTQEFLSIAEPTQRIMVSLNAEKSDGLIEELRCWSLPLLPTDGQVPLVAFDAVGIQLASTRQLPAQLVYLLLPTDVNLVFDGNAQPYDECASLVGAWRAWKMEAWNLEQAWAVGLKRNGAALGDEIPVQGAIAQPELVGGHLFQFKDLDLPLYTSDLPALQVPLAPGSTLAARLSNWQVRVRSLWEANPQIDHTIRLSEYAGRVEIQEDRALFPLKHLLGETAAGVYEVRASGPRGLGGEFQFRSWPRLMLLGYNLTLVQPGEENKPSTFILRLQPGAKIDAPASSKLIEIKETPAGFQISAPAELNRVLLDLLAPAQGGGAVRVPVSIPLPKLRWGLVVEREKNDLVWGYELIHRSIDQLLQGIQAGSVTLNLEMYGVSDLLRDLKIQLVEVDDQRTLLQEGSLNRTGITRDWLRMSLAGFADTIRAIASSAQFELVYAPRGQDEVRIPLCEVSREMKVSQVQMESIGETTYRLNWQEEYPVRNRRVMILPAWQPWQEPVEYKIPNEARETFTIHEIGLPPARYWLYFYVLPDYAKALASPPVGLQPFVIDLCTPQERLAAFSTENNGPNEVFKDLIEQAVIHDDIGEYKNRDLILSKAAIQLIHLTNLNLLLGTLAWMQNKDIDQATKSYFFATMFKKKLVETILARYSTTDPTLIEYLGYINRVKILPSDSAIILLKQVDDPATVASCLRWLVSKKDAEVSAIIMAMLNESRLSNRDALDLFASDPAWAIETVNQLPENIHTDALIAGLLPKIAQSDAFREDPRIADWMIRSLPFVEDEPVSTAYLRHLFHQAHPRRFELLRQLFDAQRLGEEEVIKMLSQDPKASVKALDSLPPTAEYQNWMRRLTEKYPEAVGIISPGSLLQTPFGVAQIDYIEDANARIVKNVRLGETGLRLNVLIGDGSERFRLVIDYQQMTLRIDGETQIWKCGMCDFAHPTQKQVTRHASKKHIAVRVNGISLPYPFTADNIEIILKNSK